MDGFNVAHFHNRNMVVEFAFHIVPQLENLSIEELVVASFPEKAVEMLVVGISMVYLCVLMPGFHHFVHATFKTCCCVVKRHGCDAATNA